MIDSDSYTTTPPETLTPPEPARRTWPLSLWIIPDALVAFALTLLASFLILGINLAIQLATGAAIWTDGLLQLADGTILYGPGASPDALQQTLMKPDFFFWSILAQNIAFATVVILRVRVLRRLPWSWLGVQWRSFGKLVLIGIGVGIAFLVMNVVLGFIFSQWLGIRQNQEEQFPVVAGDQIGQILLFIAATVLAPLGEELLFRGYIFHAIRQDLGKVAAFVISAGVFSLVHITGVTQGAPALLVPLFVGGLLLAAAVQRTGSLVPSIIAHGINNGVAMTVLITCTNFPGACTPS